MELFVYEGDNRDMVGLIELWSALSCAWRYQEPGEFELRAPMFAIRRPDDSRTWLAPGMWLWPQGRREIYIVEAVELAENEGKEEMRARGRTASSLLDRRVVDTSAKYQGYHGAILAGMFDTVFAAEARQYPGWSYNIGEDWGWEITYETSPLTLLDATEDLCRAAGLGFLTEFDPISRGLLFKIYKGRNLSGYPDAEVDPDYQSDGRIPQGAGEDSEKEPDSSGGGMWERKQRRDWWFGPHAPFWVDDPSNDHRNQWTFGDR